MMYGQMTAGSWIYIGSQGIVQGTYETFAEAGRQHYGGELADRWILTAGLGGMGGAQPLAATMAGASMLAIECQQSAHRDAPRDALSRSAGERPRRCARDRSTTRAPRKRPVSRRASSATRRKSCRSSCGAACGRDMVTDQTSAHDLVYGYLPAGWTRRALARGAGRSARSTQRSQPRRSSRSSLTSKRCSRSSAGRSDVRLRQQHPAGRARRGRGRRVRVSRLRARVHPAALLRRQGAVSLGRAVRRSGGHLQDRPQGEGALPRQCALASLARDGEASGSRSRACPRASAGSGWASGISPASPSTRW